jgi:hypothetical protein
MLTRVAALFALGLGGLFAILPRADAHDAAAVNPNSKSFLLSPERMSGERFAAFYVLAHR